MFHGQSSMAHELQGGSLGSSAHGSRTCTLAGRKSPGANGSGSIGIGILCIKNLVLGGYLEFFLVYINIYVNVGTGWVETTNQSCFIFTVSIGKSVQRIEVMAPSSKTSCLAELGSSTHDGYAAEVGGGGGF